MSPDASRTKRKHFAKYHFNLLSQYTTVNERLRESVLASPVIDKDGYPYLVHPITDGIPYVEPEILNEIIDWMLDVGDFDCDVILAPESMGIPLAIPVSLKLNIPYTVARKRRYDLPGEIIIPHKTGYSDSALYVNGVKRGDRIVIVDDVLSTGGTMSALIDALTSNGIEIVDVLVVLNKGFHGEELKEMFGVDIKTMMKIEIVNGAPAITDD